MKRKMKKRAVAEGIMNNNKIFTETLPASSSSPDLSRKQVQFFDPFTIRIYVYYSI